MHAVSGTENSPRKAYSTCLVYKEAWPGAARFRWLRGCIATGAVPAIKASVGGRDSFRENARALQRVRIMYIKMYAQ